MLKLIVPCGASSSSFILGLLIGFSMMGLNLGMRCDYYNMTMCHSSGMGCNGSEECKPNESEKGNMCYVLWQNSSNGFNIKLKGCWVGSHHDCSDRTKCLETRKEPKMQLLFCCCEGDLCNTNMHLSPLTIITPTNSGSQLTTNLPVPIPIENNPLLNTLLYTMVPLVVISTVLVSAYCFYKRRKLAHFNELPTSDPSSPSLPPTPPMALRPIQLIEVKAQGRFGSVWKAQMLSEAVAVKIFPPQDKNSWLVEQQIYQISQMKHPNILFYFGAERRGENLQAEYWLITSYHPKGSLCDHLKANLVTLNQVLSIADSVARGLMHLHEELPPLTRGGETYKPAIAHRDFKSKNVLLKSDMTACIADFGLALVFHQGHSPGDTHGQVGTRRYMAPEVLEGAISFNRDAFFRIDMYACGLVLWELLSRCSNQEGPVPEYQLPFEEEIGQHPTLEDIQDLVVQKKVRPKLKETWKKHTILGPFCDTIEECWDHDTDARLSASCVQERVSLLIRSLPSNATSENQSNHIDGTEVKTTSHRVSPQLLKTSCSVFQPKESSI